MSNKFKGQITLDNGMVMVMDFNALAAFEQITGVNAFTAIANLDNGNAKVSDLIAFYYACLKRFQPNITLEEAGDVLGEYQDALAEVIMAASPETAKETKETKATGNKKK